MPSSAFHSTPTKAPAFQFYVYEWRASRAVQRMSFAQRGMYLEMLCEQWEKGSLPDCPRACADALGGTEEEWIAAWPTLRRKFVDRRSRSRNGIDAHDPNDHNPARQIINLRLEQVRRVRRSFVNARKNAGREGGRSKAQKDKDLQAGKTLANPSNGVANASTEVVKPSSLLFSSPLISSPLHSSQLKATERARDEEPFDSFEPELPADDPVRRAGEFVERYKALHVRLRKGAQYLGNPGRDFEEARLLVSVYDDARLDKLAFVWLNTDLDFAEKGTRTIAKFRSQCSWCEERLIEWEDKHGPLKVA